MVLQYQTRTLGATALTFPSKCKLFPPECRFNPSRVNIYSFLRSSLGTSAILILITAARKPFQTVEHAKSGKPNHTQGAEEPGNRGAVRVIRTGYFQARARQLTPQANLKAASTGFGAARGNFF